MFVPATNRWQVSMNCCFSISSKSIQAAQHASPGRPEGLRNSQHRYNLITDMLEQPNGLTRKMWRAAKTLSMGYEGSWGELNFWEGAVKPSLHVCFHSGELQNGADGRAAGLRHASPERSTAAQYRQQSLQKSFWLIIQTSIQTQSHKGKSLTPDITDSMYKRAVCRLF